MAEYPKWSEVEKEVRNVAASFQPPPVPKPNLVTTEVLYMYSVAERDIFVHKGVRQFLFKAVTEGEQYGNVVEIPKALTNVYLDGKKWISNELEDGQTLVDDILHEYGKYGVFQACSKDGVPTATEVKKAIERYKEFLFTLVREADIAYMGGPDGLKNITAAHHHAANYLGYKREWNQQRIDNIQCPACSEAVPESAVVHRGAQGCGAVLNWEKAYKMGLVSKEEWMEHSEVATEVIEDPIEIQEPKKGKK